MNDVLLFHPMFRVPFATGLCLAAALCLVGAFLRMRNEWLAALGLAQIAAAGGMAAALLQVPVLVGAFGAAGLAMGLRAVLPRVGNSHHALFILVGWSATLLIGSYIDHGQRIGESMLRGQLYFTHRGHLIGAAALLLVVLVTFRWLSPRLLTARFFPDHHQANRIRVLPYRLLFAALTVSATVLGTISIGAFPAFALLFVPPWIGFVLVDGWVRSVLVSVGLGLGIYTAAFVTAMLVDLPFGPVLTGLLALAAALRFLTVLRGRRAEDNGNGGSVVDTAPSDL